MEKVLAKYKFTNLSKRKKNVCNLTTNREIESVVWNSSTKENTSSTWFYKCNQTNTQCTGNPSLTCKHSESRNRRNTPHFRTPVWPWYLNQTGFDYEGKKGQFNAYAPNKILANNPALYTTRKKIGLVQEISVASALVNPFI